MNDYDYDNEQGPQRTTWLWILTPAPIILAAIYIFTDYIPGLMDDAIILVLAILLFLALAYLANQDEASEWE